jgi:hypothetical protein
MFSRTTFLNKFLIKARLYGGFAPDSNKLVSVLLTFEKLKKPFMNKSCTGISTATPRKLSKNLVTVVAPISLLIMFDF